MRKLYTLKWKFHFMVQRSPARPSQLPDWYSSGVLTGLFLHRINPLHPGLRGGVIGLQRPSWWSVSGQTPPCYTFSPEAEASGQRVMLCGSGILFHSLESSYPPLFLGLTSQKLAFGTQAPPTLALVLAAATCRVEAQNLSQGEGSYFAGLRGAWSSPLSVWAHSTGVWFPLKLPLE